MNSWYSIKAKSADEYEVVIYDEIGFWGVTAKQFITDFKKIPENAKVNLRINSPGGDVFDSLAIHNVIKRHPGEVYGTVDGLAASGASIIAMAATVLAMPENSFLMIHNSSGFAIGNRDDMRDLADILEKIDTSLVGVYAARSGQSHEKIAELMGDETWLTAQEAKDLGLADEVIDAVKLAANLNLSRFKSPPSTLTASAAGSAVPSPTDAGPDPEPAPQSAHEDAMKEAREIVALCTKAGVADAAEGFLAKGMKAEEVKARLADADKIRARCTAARLPDRANAYIKAGMSVAEVANELFDVLLARQGPEIDNHLAPESERNEPAARPKFDSRAINERYTKNSLATR